MNTNVVSVVLLTRWQLKWIAAAVDVEIESRSLGLLASTMPSRHRHSLKRFFLHNPQERKRRRNRSGASESYVERSTHAWWGQCTLVGHVSIELALGSLDIQLES